MTAQEIEDGLNSLIKVLNVATPVLDLIPGAAPVMLIVDASLPAIVAVLTAIETIKAGGTDSNTAMTSIISHINTFTPPNAANGDFYPFNEFLKDTP